MNRELNQLLHRMVESELSEADERALVDLLRASPANRAAYLDFIALEAMLRRQFVQPAVASMASPVKPPQSWMSYVVVLASSMAAALLLWWWAHSGGVGDTAHFARVEKIDHAEWLEDPLRDGGRLGARTMAIGGGGFRLRFDNGTEVDVVGPAKLHLESPMAIRLESGRVKVVASGQATGFTVTTPSARLTDLGTEFGVVVLPDESSEVHVFDGLVVAQPLASSLVVPLGEREAARIDVHSGDLSPVKISKSDFPSLRKQSAPPQRETKTPVYEPLPANARVVFLGKQSTDRETHILLVNQALADVPGRPRLYNCGFVAMMVFTEAAYKDAVLAYRPTHAVLEFGPEAAAFVSPRSPSDFRADIIRYIERLKKDGIEPIVRLSFPLGKEQTQAQALVEQYNRILRELANAYHLRIADTERHFHAASSASGRLHGNTPATLTFAGYQLVARSLLEAFGYPETPVPQKLVLEPLPGLLRDWQWTHRDQSDPMDREKIAALKPDESWKRLHLPMADDQAFAHWSEKANSISARDRVRGFAAYLPVPANHYALAMTTIESHEERDVYLNTGALVRRIWLNGELIFDAQGKWTGWHAGKERIPIRLQKGANQLVLEAGNSFFASITDTFDWELP